MRILASGAVAGTPIQTVTEAELAFLDRVAAHDGAAAISGGLLEIATGTDASHEAQTVSSVWRVYAEPGAEAGPDAYAEPGAEADTQRGPDAGPEADPDADPEAGVNGSAEGQAGGVAQGEVAAQASAAVVGAAAQASATAVGAAAQAGPAAVGAAGELIGFGIRARQGERHAAEFVIAPDHRDRGHGEALLETILAEEPEAWCWSHGDSPAARRLAEKHGLNRDRVLYQMRTDSGLTSADLPEPTPPDDVRLRSFAPGDEAGWLAVNNAAFDWHPEQGGQTLADIDSIVGAHGFDPDSVILAVRDSPLPQPPEAATGEPIAAVRDSPLPQSPQAADQIIGFHQTKLTDTPEGRLGEVYVVGVDPAIHAKGVGRALTIEGIRRMVAAGAGAIELYVESDNAAALGLYERLGFHVAVAHVSYAPASSPQSTQE